MADVFLHNGTETDVEIYGNTDTKVEVDATLETDIISEEEEKIDIEVEQDEDISVDIDGVFIAAGEYQHYNGEYQAIPKFESQTLETKDKVMDFNVEIKPIPVEKVANTSGGNTVIIGS